MALFKTLIISSIRCKWTSVKPKKRPKNTDQTEFFSFTTLNVTKLELDLNKKDILLRPRRERRIIFMV